MLLFDGALFDGVIFDVGYEAVVSGQLPRITASITLTSLQPLPVANPDDYTVFVYLSTDSSYTARLSESSTINAIISASSTFNARLN